MSPRASSRLSFASARITAALVKVVLLPVKPRGSGIAVADSPNGRATPNKEEEHRNEKNAHCRLRGGAQPGPADRLHGVAHGPDQRAPGQLDAVGVAEHVL